MPKINIFGKISKIHLVLLWKYQIIRQFFGILSKLSLACQLVLPPVRPTTLLSVILSENQNFFCNSNKMCILRPKFLEKSKK